MLHVTKFEIKYGLLLFFSVAKKQKLLPVLKQRIFVLPEITTENGRPRKVKLVLYIDKP